MSTSWKPLALTVVAAGVTVLGLSGLVLARPAAAAESPSVAAIVRAHGGGGGGLRSEAGLAAAAEALGITVDELQTQLWAGESLADLAGAAGVDLQTVRDAVAAAHVAELRDRIAQAVAEGTLTQAKAEWLIEGLDNGHWGATEGPGFGRGGPRFFGGRNHPGAAPDAAPTTVAPTTNS